MEQHLIQKYIFDVGFDSEEKAYQVQSQLAAYIKEKIVSLTDEVFTEFSSKHTMSINRLTIDIGEIPLENLENFSSLIKSKLSEKLQLLTSGTELAFPEEQILVIPKTESDFKIIEFFLKNGTLPWSSGKVNDSQFIQKLIAEYLIEQPSEVKRLMGFSFSKEEIKIRIIRQFEDALIWKIIRLWTESETTKFQSFFSDLIKVYTRRPIVKKYIQEYRELVWRFMLTEVIALKKYKATEAELTSDFFEYASKENNISLSEIIQEYFSVIGESTSFHSEKKSYLKASDINFETKISEVIETLAKKHSVKNRLDSTKGPGERSASDPSVEKSLQSGISENTNEEKIITVKNSKQNIKLQEEFLKSFFEIISTVSDTSSIKEDIVKAEILIEKFVRSNSLFLQKLLKYNRIEINEIRGQKAIHHFSPEIQNLLIREVFRVENNTIESLIDKASEEVVLVFLQTGVPPYAQLPIPFNKEDFEQIVISVLERDKEGKLSNILNSNYKLIDGIQRYFNKEELKKYAVRSEVSEKKKSGKTAVKPVKLSDVNTSDKLIDILYSYLADNILPKHFEFTAEEVIVKFYSGYFTEARTYFAGLNENEFEKILRGIIPSLPSDISTSILELRSNLHQSIKKIKETKVEEISYDKETQAEGPKVPFKKFESGEPVYINNAGLVIFHPYLSRFFKMFDLLDKKMFKDEFSAHKAAHLLQYLVNKSLNNEEHEMTLNKLLCGIDLSVPLIRDIEITEEEKNICEGLIEGVIQNWSILKKTSNDNFRASFVIREGRLQLEGRDWKLKVEERGYDILVEKLPWAISMVKLPWMNQMIYVEWK